MSYLATEKIIGSIKLAEAGTARFEFRRLPVLSGSATCSPIPPEQGIGRKEALFRRTDHRLSA